jgi:hypothetical protein
MPGHRHRTKTGILTRKRADTMARTLKSKCHVAIPDWVDGKTQLKTLRELTGMIGVHQVSIALMGLEPRFFPVKGQPLN